MNLFKSLFRKRPAETIPNSYWVYFSRKEATEGEKGLKLQGINVKAVRPTKEFLKNLKMLDKEGSKEFGNKPVFSKIPEWVIPMKKKRPSWF